ncbi:acyltransferase family protein [Arthrobacter sp. 08Y14]|uniref:acyltransferase family protein n=1 Tax=Arthrobacter sp. 08Y14 TaxID=2058885 RepID=UPI000CE51C67|nr:acyltransferase family protein [Arthrobacter sp. 08Y14]
MTHFASIRKNKQRRSPGEVQRGFRTDVQGLRAVAVGIVLIYHAGLEWMPGGFVGVDVFFVISGFLITAGIVKEIQRTGRFSFLGFYGRRAARILPAATVTLIGVTLLCYLLMPITRWMQVGRDAMASGVYAVNWIFARDSVSYLANDQSPSPFQHFWSLAVEEQFYLFWPLVLVVFAWIAAKTKHRIIVGFSLALIVIGFPSFLWSIYLTSDNPAAAYFVTTTRLWELIIGASLAVFVGIGKNIPDVIAAIIGWTGLGIIIIVAIKFDGATSFPSYNAALPTLGAAMVLWAGRTGVNFGPVAVLGTKPMVAIGAISYSLYLWHWPMLVLAEAVFGPLSALVGLAVVASACVPAWASLRYVERPFIKWSKEQKSSKAAVKTGGVLTLSAVTVGALLAVAVPPVPPTTDTEFVATNLGQENASDTPVGAEVLLQDQDQGNPQKSFPSITPSAIAAPTDIPKTCLKSELSEDVEKCSFGDLSSTTVLAMVGDSHAAMLVPGVAAAVSERGWRLDVYTKGSCPLTAAVILLDGKPYDNCLNWGKNVSESILNQPPTALIVATSKYKVAGIESSEANNNALVQGMRDAWKPFIEEGVQVISIRDTPRPGVLVPDCVAQNENDLAACAMKKEEILSSLVPELEAVEGLDRAHAVDLTEAICPNELCPAVIGGIQIYRDSNHITATYARTMHAQIGTALDRVLLSNPANR